MSYNSIYTPEERLIIRKIGDLKVCMRRTKNKQTFLKYEKILLEHIKKLGGKYKGTLTIDKKF